MGSKQLASFGTAILAWFVLPFDLAFADNANQNASGSASSGQSSPAFHPNLYKFNFRQLEEKAIESPPQAIGGSVLQQGKAAQSGNPSSGLHWTTVDSHPGLGYQIDKNEEVRLRFGAHGVKANFALSF